MESLIVVRKVSLENWTTLWYGQNMGDSSRWAVVLFCIVVGILIGTGGYTFHYARGISYLSNNPLACVNCHVMQEHFDSWVKSSHHAVATCNDCHIPHTFPDKYLAKLRNGWNHSKAFTLQNFAEPVRIRPKNLEILQDNCIHCHNVLVSEMSGHRGISSGDARRCTECHRSVGHLSVAD